MVRRNHVEHQPDRGQQGHDDRRPLPRGVLAVGNLLFLLDDPPNDAENSGSLSWQAGW
jgi:hypothetical protein